VHTSLRRLSLPLVLAAALSPFIALGADSPPPPRRVASKGLAFSFELPSSWEVAEGAISDADAATQQDRQYMVRQLPSSGTATAWCLTVRVSLDYPSFPADLGFSSQGRRLVLDGRGTGYASLISGDGWFGLSGMAPVGTHDDRGFSGFTDEFRALLFSFTDSRRVSFEGSESCGAQLILRSLVLSPLPTDAP